VLGGLDRAPDGLGRLCAGENLGKQLIRFLD
jgi:NADPH-dependent curcumin reductase CurA